MRPKKAVTTEQLLVASLEQTVTSLKQLVAKEEQIVAKKEMVVVRNKNIVMTSGPKLTTKPAYVVANTTTSAPKETHVTKEHTFAATNPATSE